MGVPDITKAEQVYVAVRRRIFRLEMLPGNVLSEAALASEFCVSRTPVREALTQLDREGLVEVTARAGYKVRPVTLKHAREMLAVRTLLECEAAALAASRATDAEGLRELSALCQATYRPDEPASIDDFLAENSRFHVKIAQIGDNSLLTKMLGDILEQLERLFRVGLALSSRSEEIVNEHTDLVDAILAGDAPRAREIAGAQCRSSHKMIVDAILASEPIALANVVPIGLATGA